MTTTKTEIKIYESSEKGVTAMRKASFRNTGPDRYVRLSDYEELKSELDSHKAARIAYASEFPLDEDGNPDVGSIHQNIRTLKAECEKLQKDAERYRYIKEGNQWIVAATQTGYHLGGEDLDDLIDSEMGQQK